MKLRPSLALTILVVVGVVVRLLPWLMDPDIALRDDAAFHLRMVREVVDSGRVPEVDRLSDAPEGRRIAEQLPLGLYCLAAWSHRALATFDHGDVRRHVIFFVALAGALVVVPVYLASRALGASVAAGLLAALVTSLLPAHLHRTFGHWVRYDALGVTLIFMHVAFVLRALRDGPRRAWDAVAAAVALVAAAAVWRVSLTLPVIESVWLLLALAVRGSTRGQRDLFVVLAATGSAAFAVMAPMRSQNFVASPAWIFFVVVACAGLIATEARPWMVRAAVVIAAVALVAVAARVVPAGSYESTFDLVALRLQQMLNAGSGTTALTRLRLDVVELYGLTPPALLIGPEQFLALGPWTLGAPIYFAWRASRREGGIGRAFGSGPGLASVLAIAWIVLTLALGRNKVLLAPWVAVATGLVADALWAQPQVPALPTHRGPATRTPSRTSRGRFALRALFVASVVATCATGLLLARSRRASYPVDLVRACEFLRTTTPFDAIVAAPWWNGYEIQALGERATVVDGLLEDHVNEQRILELHAAFLDRDPASLRRVCNERHVTHVLVPDPEEISNVAWITDPDLVRSIESGRPASADDLSRTIVRLMRRETIPGFASVFETETLRLMRVEAEP